MLFRSANNNINNSNNIVIKEKECDSNFKSEDRFVGDNTNNNINIINNNNNENNNENELNEEQEIVNNDFNDLNYDENKIIEEFDNILNEPVIKSSIANNQNLTNNNNKKFQDNNELGKYLKEEFGIY